MKSRIVLLLGTGLATIGVLQAMVWHQPHFYSAFSVGAAILLYCLYETVTGKRLFAGWGLYRLCWYVTVTIVVCIMIDRMGMHLGYWHYPAYHSAWDALLKYVFEWFVPFQYLMFVLLIAKDGLRKHGIGLTCAAGAALLAVTLAGLVTESLNHAAGSWVVAAMPLTNYQIGSYFLIFQTIGYWLMAFIPLVVYLGLGRQAQPR